ncbi:MAG: hypothetical protein ACTJHC_00275 [Vagococcus sp.]
MLAPSDKRKHFRFPVYEDETGVKLTKKNNRGFLRDVLDDGFDYKTSRIPEMKDMSPRIMELDPVEMVDAPDYFGTDGLPDVNEVVEAPRSIKKERTAFEEKKVTLKQAKPRDTATHKAGKNLYAEPKTASFKAPQSSFSNKYYEMDAYGHAKHRKIEKKKASFESSYHLPGEVDKTMFRPKHIPASLIEEDANYERPRHNRETIVDELRKVSSSNLLLMEEPDLDDETVMEQGNQAISGSKKKNQRLEKSLSGIIADEATPHMDNNYFD